MAAIHELLRQVDDIALRKRLEDEVDKLTENKKFGLVFEEHVSECIPLYGVKISRGRLVAKKDNISDTYIVLKVSENKAVCHNKVTGKNETIDIDNLVCVSEFGEPVYPALEQVDMIERAPDSDLWHILIEAENYHALQLLEYTTAGQIDCIYIDPPYNTDHDEWKYNDSFIDSKDRWAHSLWLSMMKRRLVLARNLLADKGTIIISIGYQEVNRLVLLCEELFPDKQVVTVTVQTSGGKPSGGFNYLQEYLVFITPKDFISHGVQFSGGKYRTPYEGMTLATFTQSTRPNQTYPIFVDKDTKKIVGCGKSLAERISDGTYTGEMQDFEYKYDEAPDGCVAI